MHVGTAVQLNVKMKRVNHLKKGLISQVVITKFYFHARLHPELPVWLFRKTVHVTTWQFNFTATAHLLQVRISFITFYVIYTNMLILLKKKLK